MKQPLRPSNRLRQFSAAMTLVPPTNEIMHHIWISKQQTRLLRMSEITALGISVVCCELTMTILTNDLPEYRVD